jgi:hypothetical protein
MIEELENCIRLIEAIKKNPDSRIKNEMKRVLLNKLKRIQHETIKNL